MRRRREQAQLRTRHEPHECAFALADGAVAGHGAGEFAFDLESDVAAVAAALVGGHGGAPSVRGAGMWQWAAGFQQGLEVGQNGGPAARDAFEHGFIEFVVRHGEPHQGLGVGFHVDGQP